jgi:hypothetical protein
MAMTMWTLITSDGRRVPNIDSEVDARRAAHALGPVAWSLLVGRCGRPGPSVRRRDQASGRKDSVVIVGRYPPTPVIGDTVLSRADHTRGSGVIVDTDAIRYRVYWRDGSGTLCWHARRELTVPRLDYRHDVHAPTDATYWKAGR